MKQNEINVLLDKIKKIEKKINHIEQLNTRIYHKMVKQEWDLEVEKSNRENLILLNEAILKSKQV